MTRQVLMERLCALVPKPRRHLVTYHRVFAPAAGIRSRVADPAGILKLAAGDCDGDGDLDAVVGTYPATVRLWQNLGQGQFVDVGGVYQEPNVVPQSQPWLVDTDDDGDLDLAIGTRIFTNQRWGADAQLLCRIGRNFPLRFRSAAAIAGCEVWPFFGLQTGRLPLPPFGTLAIAPSAAILLPRATLSSGEVIVNFVIPADPGLVGIELTVQGLLTAAPTPRLSPPVRVNVHG